MVFFFPFLRFMYLIFCCGGFLSLCRPSLVVISMATLVVVRRVLVAVAPLVAEHRLEAHWLQELGLTGSRAWAQEWWLTGVVAPRHMRSSWTRD